MTVRVQEIRIAAMLGLEIPEGITEGSTLTITATLHVSKVDQDWIDVTSQAGKPEILPGGTTLGCVATQWSAT